MARNRSVDFLPEIFKTDTNKEFLSATLDQLVQQPKLKRIEGYIGNQFKSGASAGERYLTEPTVERANYQLESTVVFKNDNNTVETAITYPEILDALKTKGAITTKHDRLFSSDVYAWSPLIDLDKFVNHSQYYWLPQGPDPVDVSATLVNLTDEFEVSDTEDGYTFSGVGGNNPTLILSRGGEYTFNVDQDAKFWIQTQPGTDGTLDESPNISSRQVLGVTNNGTAGGTITFAVPSAVAQKFYHELTEVDAVDLTTTAKFNEIHGQDTDELTSIDGVTDLEGKTIVFLDTTPGSAGDTGWYRQLGSFAIEDFEDIPSSDVETIDDQADRYSVYRIQFIDDSGTTRIKLNRVRSVAVHTKFTILYGDKYSGYNFYKNKGGYFEQIPALTAAENKLYYQDANDASKSGIISLVDSTTDAILNIEQDIIGKENYKSPNGVSFTNGLKVIFRGTVYPSSYQHKEYYVEGVGDAIQLIEVDSLITPETYTESDTQPYDSLPYDSDAFDGALNAPLETDYLTISRASIDRNAWSRSNRWTHRDVIEQTAGYNNTVAVFDNDKRANRPIIEFKTNLKLFNYGTVFKDSVTVIDFTETDALSNVQGSASHTVDGLALQEDAKIIFANDNDSDVKNKIYRVNFVDVDDDGNSEIRLTEVDNPTVLTDELVVATNGLTQQGKAYHFDGEDWISSQQKTDVNQAPLFDVFDPNGKSFSDSATYKRTDFAGTKLFSYAEGTGTNDTILGFPLKYLSIDNIGDIVFDNNLYKDTFAYSIPEVTKNISDGYIRKYSDRTTYTNEIGWTSYIDEFVDSQVFEFEYDGVSLVLDVLPKSGLSTPTIKVFVDGVYYNDDKYTITENTNSTTVTFNQTVTTGATVFVTIISDQVSAVAYYEVPTNLENNPFNGNSQDFTLGSIRNHYTELAQNIPDLTGEVNGANNSRDLATIEKYSRSVLQHSSPIVPLAEFLHSDEFDFFKSLEFSSHAYEKFKLKLVDWVNRNDTNDMLVSDILDEALKEINVGKSNLTAFYKSDMLAGATAPTVLEYETNTITTNVFNTNEIYDFTEANRKAILVYKNNEILTKDSEYTVQAEAATVTVLVDLPAGTKIKIKEYDTTVGSYVPSTPSKLGLHPVYEPRKYTDTTYQTNTDVIQGHDGSITVAYGDVRDDVLLEFEKRIYNNIKISADNQIPLIEADIIPGKFRTTDYTDEEITSILSTSFLSWVGFNRVDYKTQDYNTANEWTWNYSTAASNLDGSALKGYWRGVYKNYYDTDTPHLTPWEMLGYSKRPTWWDEEYSAGPYTRGNTVLWDDIEAGYIREPGNERYNTKFARPGLSKVIPVDTSGNLLDPFEAIVTSYNRPDFKKSWVFGDQGPTETAWRRSSSYRFALQRLFALTKPAKYFALNIDRDRYVYDSTLGQYLYDSRYRLNSNDVEIQTEAKPKHSYIDWIADYHNNNGCSCVEIKNELAKTDVRLSYRMGSFSGKNYLKVFTDKSNPDSTNTGLQIPDENYHLLLHKNQSAVELHYSAVVVEKTASGYSVSGHSKTHPYFEIYKSVTDGNATKIGDYLVPTKFTKSVTTVPYGYTFTSKGGIVDFLASYGAFLEDKGLIFDSAENGEVLNWGKMSQEFLAWSAQDWGVGAIVNLNPVAMYLEFNKELTIVDNIAENELGVLDQNGLPLGTKDYVITRLDNSFKIQTINNKSINFIRLKSISYEHLMVFDNSSIFNDLIYAPDTGLRQQRLKLVGFTTYEWNGQLDAQGFILNQDVVESWTQNTIYTRGSIVEYKNNYWSAVANLEPSQTFDFNNWSKIDYSSIQTGLLPNISNKIGQIEDYYNKNITNLESDVDLLALGLTGYRPRQYLKNLDDVSRVNFYSGFIAEKGTTDSAEVFRGVNLDKQLTDYEVYENYGIKQASYGNSDNRRYIEFELQKNLLQNNPSIVEVSNATKTDPWQIVKTNEIYNESTTHNSISIYPKRTSRLTDTQLPNAGFVHTSDVDIALWQKSDLNDTAGIVFLNQVEDGTTLWVAKDNTYDWNVYQADQTANIKSIVENDTGVLTVTFYDDHELVERDSLIIANISAEVNGHHRVTNWVSTTVVEIAGTIETAYAMVSADSTTVTSDSTEYSADHTLGECYKLTSLRVDTINNLEQTYFDNLANGSFAWVNDNPNNKTATYKKVDSEWELYREEQFAVDVELINNCLLYNKDTNLAVSNLDYINPLNGKILGQAQENIDYITTYDPANYNLDNQTSTGIIWAENQVGRIWWDVSNTRFLNCNFTDKVYASKNWGALFPGSTVDLRQWIKSSTPPSQYTGEGAVVDANSYTVVSHINSANTIVQSYYFWVSGLTSVHTNKTLSLDTISDYITTPRTTGIAYLAFLDESTVALYNSTKYVEDSILHIAYDLTAHENSVFNEFNIIKRNNKYDFLSDNTFLKLQDSLVGGNKIGLRVPDEKLSPALQIGVGFRPRQSMFRNRLLALQSYLTYVNSVLADNIIATNKSFDTLNLEEEMPSASSGEYDLKVADIDELNYQTLAAVSVGYKYLVEVDENNNSGWSIYEVVAGPKLQLIRVQTYNTANAWQYIDWYADDNARNAIFEKSVSDPSKLTSLSVEDDSYVKVLDNNVGKFEVYKYSNSNWVRVGLEDGTIEFKSSLWSGESTIDSLSADTDLFTVDNVYLTVDKGTGGNELRNCIKAINEDLFVDDLLLERNKSLMTVLDYILTEQEDIDWLIKTSYVDVTQKVRDLSQYATYKKDDQEFLQNYINESKPYHVTVKDFLLKYDGSDQYNTDIADFDCPVYFDSTFEKYISPVLDYNGSVLKSDSSNFDDDGKGLKEVDYNIWELDPWSNWYNNRGLSIASIIVEDQGSGYDENTTITISSNESTTTATAKPVVNSAGNIISVTITDAGANYYSIPTITISGVGSGAKLRAKMQNKLVRNTKTTLKYDRLEYSHKVVQWVANETLSVTADDTTVTVDERSLTVDDSTTTFTADLDTVTADETRNITVDSDDTTYEAGQLVRYENKVYTQNERHAFKDKFYLDDYTLADSTELTSADRTMGYYTPSANQPGLNLALLIKGTDYPGVLVDDLDFDQTDTLDAVIESEFGDTYLGTRADGTLVTGGNFIDEYSSHSPDELTPGSMFDTLDLKVHTRPGFDYQNNGHGFDTDFVAHEFDLSSPTLSFAQVVEHPCTIIVLNATNGQRLHIDHDYDSNWADKTITITNGALTGDTILIQVYEIGGGNQLYRHTVVGDTFDTELTLPVRSTDIYDVVIFLNGKKLNSGFSTTSDSKVTADNTVTTADTNAITVDRVTANDNNKTTITFQENYGADDFLAITVFGFSTPQHDWCTPVVSHFQTRNMDTTEVTADDTTITVDSEWFNLGDTDIYVGDKNRFNAIVEKNGFRLRPPEAVRYLGDGVETVFRLPTTGDIDHTLVSNSEIAVFVDETLKSRNVDYTVVSVVDGGVTYKEINFITAPETDTRVDVYTTNAAQYTIDSLGVVRVKPTVTLVGSDELDVTTYNDTEQLDILTSVFVGPTTVTTQIIEFFDSNPFDQNGTTGFDFVTNSDGDTNIFDLGRTVTSDNRLWVTRNGLFLTPDVDYAVSENYVYLAGEIIGPSDVISVTSYTSNLVPDELSFRYFKDMRGNSAMYKINTCCLTEVKLTRELSATDDVVYVDNASQLPVPNLELGNFGIVMINNERITYRELDTVANTVSGLRRGTAGTGANTHAIGSFVEDMTATNLVENTVYESSTFGSDASESSYVGDKIWYAQATYTASDGIALQNQDTTQAEFLKRKQN